ncbi:hypothetical protein Hamer_G016243 [Homarus americanus]|uniref:Uncharacterized protein n=1 Tax=Homarus americanus TaxID=6706 RepID=A0A8J5MRT0_HOMAM|nr:hypothetical protein Hamer_G016243 [Homarus americanus]
MEKSVYILVSTLNLVFTTSQRSSTSTTPTRTCRVRCFPPTPPPSTPSAGNKNGSRRPPNSAPAGCSPTTFTPVWCESMGRAKVEGRASTGGGQTVMQRKIDTDTDQNAIENNEIQGSTIPDEEEGSWLTTFLRFFGYKSIGEMVQNIDIFSIPSKIQSLVRTYNDEISMGQCYMEFTTYNALSGRVFSFLRESLAALRRGVGRDSLVLGLVGMLEGSPTTKQYADVIKQFMPMVMQMYNSDDPSSAITAFISHTLGPYLSQIQSAPSKNPNSINNNSPKPDHWPNLRPKPTPAPKTTPRPPSSLLGGSGGDSSPVTTMVLEFLKYYMGNYLSSLPGNSPTRPPPPPVRTPAPRPPAAAPSPVASSPAASSPGLGSILSFLFPSSQSQKVSQPKPPVTKRPQKPQVLEKHDAKTFVDMVLEFIRPVFISIIGKAPGESGVASIREVTRLSSLGRVDDTLVEEVLSPYFCIKNYVVNKAWTLTERGVRSVASKFNPEEQARMLRMLQDN